MTILRARVSWQFLASLRASATLEVVDSLFLSPEAPKRIASGVQREIGSAAPELAG
jgi:hypothetical protein